MVNYSTAASATTITATGLTGATAASRYAGATASGAPVSGTFATGDFIIDQTGKIWVCTAPGTPGTWAQQGAVTGVTAGDASVVVGGSGAAPTVRTGTLDVIAAQHPAAADWSNNSHKITSLANGSAATDAAAFGQVNAIQATTGTTGYALVNGTGNIITWTTPNDGALHRVTVYGSLFATTTETGGQISLSYTDPGSNANTTTIWAAALTGANAAQGKTVTCKANTAVTLTQATALTAGGPTTLWAEIWGS